MAGGRFITSAAAALSATATCLICVAVPTLAAAQYCAYVTSRAGFPGSGAFLHLVDPAASAVVATEPFPGEPVQDIQAINFSPDGDLAYADTATDEGSTRSDHVTVIEPRARRYIARLPAVRGAYGGFAFSPDGASLYLTNLARGTLSVLSTRDQTTIASITSGSNRRLAEPMSVSSDGALAYVAGELEDASGHLSVIDISARRLIDAIPTGAGQPTSLVLTPDGRFAYVGHYACTTYPDCPDPDAGAISVLDLEERRIVTTFDLPTRPLPGSAAVHPSGSHVYIATGCSDESACIPPITGEKKTPVVAVIETATNRLLLTVAYGDESQSLVVTPDGRFVVVAPHSTFEPLPDPPYGRYVGPDLFILDTADFSSRTQRLPLPPGATSQNVQGMAIAPYPCPQPPGPTPTPGPCYGDCNSNGVVMVDELVRGVNMALGNLSAADCPAFDTNNDMLVTVDELIRAVSAALGGCVP